MKTKTILGAASMLALLAGPALAQTATPQTTTSPATSGMAMTPSNAPGMAKSGAGNDQTDKVTADGYMRAGKLEGADVYNSGDTSIGTVDDLLIGEHDKAAMAVVSVGGFLGIDSKLVKVPFSKLKMNKEGHLILAGATKASLTKLPSYSYSK